MTVEVLTRVFKAGSLNLPDPDPNMSPEEVKAVYTVNYPHLADANIEGPTQEGDDTLVYSFVPSPAKTKG